MLVRWQEERFQIKIKVQLKIRKKNSVFQQQQQKKRVWIFGVVTYNKVILWYCKVTWDENWEIHIFLFFFVFIFMFKGLNHLRIKAPTFVSEYSMFIQVCSFLLWGRQSGLAKRGRKSRVYKKVEEEPFNSHHTWLSQERLCISYECDIENLYFL